MVGPVSAMTAFVAHVQGANPQTGLYVLTATNQSILFSVPLTGTVVGITYVGSVETDTDNPSLSYRSAHWHLHLYNLASVANGH